MYVPSWSASVGSGCRVRCRSAGRARIFPVNVTHRAMAMASASAAVDDMRALLQRMQHHDKDERYMAISDLKSMIESLPNLDAAMQATVRQEIFKRLQDSSSDVQAIALNCLCSIVQKFETSEVIEIVSALGSLSRTGDASLRDMYAEGLRVILDYVPVDLGELVTKQLLPPILKILRRDQGADRESYETDRAPCLVLLQSLMGHFPSSSFGDAHLQDILGILLGLLGTDAHDDTSIPILIKSFAGIATPSMLDQLVRHLIGQAPQQGNQSRRTAALVFTLECVCLKVGARMAPYIAQLVPVLESLAQLRHAPALSDAEETIVSVRQHALTIFESLVASSPKQMTPFIAGLVKLTLSLLPLDPNFVADDDETMTDADGEWDDGGGDGDDWGLEVDATGADDAGDTTWKVRLASCNVLIALVEAHDLAAVVIKALPDIVDAARQRLTEREPAVQTQVFSVIAAACRNAPLLDAAAHSAGSATGVIAKACPALVASLMHHLGSASTSASLPATTTLLELIRAIRPPTSLVLAPVLQVCRDGRDVSVQMVALEALREVLASASPPDIDVPAVITTLTDPSMTNAKLQPGVFAAMAAVCHAVRGRPVDLSAILRTVLALPSEGACRVLSVYVASGHGSDQGVVQVVVERLLTLAQDKSCRVAAVHALTTMARGEYAPDALSAYASSCTTAALDLLDAKEPGLLYEVVDLVDAYLGKFASAFQQPVLYRALTTLSSLQSSLMSSSEADAALLTIVASVLANLLARVQAVPEPVVTGIVNLSCDAIAKSETLPRPALAALNAVLASIATLSGGKYYASLLSRLMDLSKRPGFPPACYSPLAVAIATCMTRGAADSLDAAVTSLLQTFQDPNADRQLSLFVIGAVGERHRLPGAQVQALFPLLLALASDGNESVKAAASTALGQCAAGNNVLIAPIVANLETHDAVNSYFLLHSLKELLVNSATLHVQRDHLDAFARILWRYAESADEGVRLMVSECLGKLLILAPDVMVPDAESHLSSSSPRTLSTVVTAFAFSFSSPVVSSVSPGRILALLSASDIEVQRQAFIAVTAMLQSASRRLLTRQHVLDVIVPAVLGSVRVRHELIRQIDFGQFKETVDEGLVLRLAAYGCLRVLRDVVTGADVVPFARAVLDAMSKHGLGDPDRDLHLQAYDLILWVSSTIPHSEPLGFLEDLPDRMMPAVKARLTQLKRSPADSDARAALLAFVRTMHALHSLSGVVTECPKFHVFYQQVLKTAVLAEMLDGLTAKPRRSSP